MLMNYHIGRLVLSSLCVGAFGAAGFLVVFVLRASACDSVLTECLNKAEACRSIYCEWYSVYRIYSRNSRHRVIHASLEFPVRLTAVRTMLSGRLRKMWMKKVNQRRTIVLRKRAMMHNGPL